MRHQARKIAFLGLCTAVAMVFAWVESLLPPIVAVSLLFGNPMTRAYSLAGGFLSLLVMTLLRKADLLSTVGVSVAGGVFHNVGQILMAMLLMGTAELGYYLIVLAVTGTVSGIFVGLCGSFAVRRVQIR